MAAAKESGGRPAAEELERLYLQPPERFTAERDALAKRLREDGDREAAEDVKKLRKPSLAAWLVNQLGLREAKDVEELLDAGARLRKTEEAMMRGKGDAGDLRAAAADEREAVERLVEAARRIAADDDRKLNQTMLDRVAETLQAANADEELAEKLREGRFEKEAKRATIGTGALPAATGRGRRSDAKAKASRERKEAEAELDSARRDLERAEGVVERAQADVDLHSERLKGAKDALSKARREAKAAVAELRRAEARAKKS
jgi:hypothetical protein